VFTILKDFWQLGGNDSPVSDYEPRIGCPLRRCLRLHFTPDALTAFAIRFHGSMLKIAPLFNRKWARGTPTDFLT
jgi:hypothetical protein